MKCTRREAIVTPQAIRRGDTDFTSGNQDSSRHWGRDCQDQSRQGVHPGGGPASPRLEGESRGMCGSPPSRGRVWGQRGRRARDGLRRSTHQRRNPAGRRVSGEGDGSRSRDRPQSPRTEGPGGLQSAGSPRVRHD